MQFQPTISFLEENLPQDDIDRLFSQLQPIEPPASFVSRILSQLPTHVASASLVSQPVAWNNLDYWVARNKKQRLC